MTVRRVVAGLLVVAVVTGCTSSGGDPALPASSLPGTPTSTALSTRTSSAPVPTEVQAVLVLLEQLNATAGGPVADQRAVIDAAVDPGQVAAQGSCGTATTTLSFEPDAARARPRPDWEPPSGTVDGAVWGIPVLMRIHSGDRIVGTDLTELHVVVAADGTARLPAMCIN